MRQRLRSSTCSILTSNNANEIEPPFFSSFRSHDLGFFFFFWKFYWTRLRFFLFSSCSRVFEVHPASVSISAILIRRAVNDELWNRELRSTKIFPCLLLFPFFSNLAFVVVNVSELMLGKYWILVYVLYFYFDWEFEKRILCQELVFFSSVFFRETLWKGGVKGAARTKMNYLLQCVQRFFKSKNGSRTVFSPSRNLCFSLFFYSSFEVSSSKRKSQI